MLDISTSFSDVLRKAGVYPNGNNVNRLKKIIENNNLDTTLLEYNRKELCKKYTQINRKLMQIPIDKLFIVDSISATSVVKKRIIRENLIPYICYKCGNVGNWEGEKLVLILDHENGIPNDNRLENLRFVCPNCDSQSSTYKGRNVRWVKKVCKDCGNPIDRKNKKGYCRHCLYTNHKDLLAIQEGKRKLSKEEVIEIIENKENLSDVRLGNKYKVSNNTIKKVRQNKGYKGDTYK